MAPKSDNLTPEQRDRVELLKAQRKTLQSPIDRIAFDNAANSERGDDHVLRFIAAMEVELA